MKLKNGMELTSITNAVEDSRYFTAWIKRSGKKNVPHQHGLFFKTTGEEVFCKLYGHRDSCGCCCIADY